MKINAKDGHLYAVVNLQDVVENYDVSDMPILTEVKRLYDENKKLREMVQYILDKNYGDDWFAMKAEELGLEAKY